MPELDSTQQSIIATIGFSIIVAIVAIIIVMVIIVVAVITMAIVVVAIVSNIVVIIATIGFVILVAIVAIIIRPGDSSVGHCSCEGNSGSGLDKKTQCDACVCV